MPTLVIVGDRDVTTPPERSERISERIPDCQLVVIPESGHMTPVEEPGAFNAALEEFLASLSRE